MRKISPLFGPANTTRWINQNFTLNSLRMSGKWKINSSLGLAETLGTDTDPSCLAGVREIMVFHSLMHLFLILCSRVIGFSWSFFFFFLLFSSLCLLVVPFCRFPQCSIQNQNIWEAQRKTGEIMIISFLKFHCP